MTKRSHISQSNSITLLTLLLTSYTICNYEGVNAFIVPSSISSTFKVQSSISVEQHAELKSSTREKHEEEDEATHDDNDAKVPVSVLPNLESPNTESNSPQPKFSKLQRLKDRMWVRETLEDLTAAEFARNLAASSTEEDEEKKKNKKSSVDFENILAKLEKRIEDMCIKSTYGNEDVACITSHPLHDAISSTASPDPEDECWSLMHNYGMGSVTYTDDQRSALVS